MNYLRSAKKFEILKNVSIKISKIIIKTGTNSTHVYIQTKLFVENVTDIGYN